MLTYDSHMPWQDENLDLINCFDLIDLDQQFANSPHSKIINNFNLISPNLSREYTDQIFSNADDELGFEPTCECGMTCGVIKEGLICPQCGTVCSTGFTDVMTHQIWLGVPQELPPVIHPVWYMIMHTWTAIGRYDSVLDSILNPKSEIPEDFEPYMHDELRGFQYFYAHADEILDILINQYERTAKKPMAEWMIPFREKYRHLLFTRHLPILHSSLHPLKKNGETMNYIDTTSKELLKAIIDMSAVTYRQHATTVNSRQQYRTLYNVYKNMITYYTSLVSTKLGSKQGLLRKHCYGSRVHFSFRSVVVPQTIPLPMDEVLLPWCTIVNGLKLVIINFLMTRFNKSFNEALQIFFHALVKYDETVDQCLKMFINECPDHKGCIILGRNPTLAYGSIYQLFYTDFKRDPADQTIGINACIVSSANIDFDGK